MKSNHLVLVKGGRRDASTHHWPGTIEQAITSAIHAGFLVGQHVRLGRVDGSVVGYNIGNYGHFSGATYPLLVKTEFGVAKCSLHEVAAA